MKHLPLSLLLALSSIGGLAHATFSATRTTTLTFPEKQILMPQTDVNQARQNPIFTLSITLPITQSSDGGPVFPGNPPATSTSSPSSSSSPEPQKNSSEDSSSSSSSRAARTSSSRTSSRTPDRSSTVQTTTPPAETSQLTQSASIDPSTPFSFPYEVFTLAPPPPNWPYTKPGVARRPGRTATWTFQSSDNSTVALYEASLMWSPRPIGKQTKISIPFPVAPSSTSDTGTIATRTTASTRPASTSPSSSLVATSIGEVSHLHQGH
ncbi:hypothetical protein BDV96DRAFT_606693 [Lophiotrema nucula]|uniref:Ser-Thr-rich glycosyl-phosphatidyl-inositol-anchored membrane family-domain-containing protein n=1 Tax=Lophiotrema nucula TaxID=690887 RepID=A0A6A5YLQ9_9PLEO|nr:hypothetical protein BDV96DRAFT_606693 [Lophiotrema nucula]